MTIRNTLVLAVALACTGLASAQSVQVPRPVPYEDTDEVAENIRTECKINEQLADFIQEYAKKNGVEVTFGGANVDVNASGRVLDVKITSAISMGNAFMGHQKASSVSGTLYENGQKVASFKARRQSMGGAFAGYKGSCSVLGRTIEAMGKDIGLWLKSPVDGAKLGDF